MFPDKSWQVTNFHSTCVSFTSSCDPGILVQQLLIMSSSLRRGWSQDLFTTFDPSGGLSKQLPNPFGRIIPLLPHFQFHGHTGERASHKLSPLLHLVPVSFMALGRTAGWDGSGIWYVDLLIGHGSPLLAWKCVIVGRCRISKTNSYLLMFMDGFGGHWSEGMVIVCKSR